MQQNGSVGSASICVRVAELTSSNTAKNAAGFADSSGKDSQIRRCVCQSSDIRQQMYLYSGNTEQVRVFN